MAKLIEIKPLCTLFCPDSWLKFWILIKMSKSLTVSEVALSLILKELSGYNLAPRSLPRNINRFKNVFSQWDISVRSMVRQKGLALAMGLRPSFAAS